MILGENDELFEAEYMQKELKNLEWRGKVHVLNGVGHRVVTERKKVEEFILAFWDDFKTNNN
jgi:hypothetical protein